MKLEKENTQKMITNESRKGRKRLLGAGLMSVVFMAISMFQINTTAGVAHPGVGGKQVVFDIVPDSATTGTAAASAPGVPISAPGTTFFLTGKIYRYRTILQEDCKFRIPCGEDDPCFMGTWRAWGTVGDGGRLVLHHTLELTPFNSTIEVQGTTGILAPNGGATSAVPGSLGPPTTGPSEILAVVGGTGRYEALSGQASIRPYCNPTVNGTSPFRYDRAFCLGVD